MLEIKKGLYKHFKGHRYFVHNVAKHSETMEDFVVYETLGDCQGSPAHSFFVRPLSMFFEEVDKPEFNYKGPRFIYLGE